MRTKALQLWLILQAFALRVGLGLVTGVKCPPRVKCPTTTVDGVVVMAEPEQIHISLAAPRPRGKYDMAVSWVTWSSSKTHVYWGKSMEDLDYLVEGHSTSYSYNHPDYPVYTSGFLHTATIVGLEPSTRYFYSCGDTEEGLSEPRSFRTPPDVGRSQAVTLSILGDLGQTTDSKNTLDALGRDASLDVVLHAGDLSYADCDQPRWDSFLRLLEPVASRLPWMVSAGNHEIEYGSEDGTPFTSFEARFAMPSVGPALRSMDCGVGGGLDGNGGLEACGMGRMEDEELWGDHFAETALSALEAKAGMDLRPAEEATVEDSEIKAEGVAKIQCCPSEWSGTYDFGNSFYSFDVASVHVVMINPYTASGKDSTQYNWLVKDLESADRSVTPWVVVVMHCPWYNTNLAHQLERQAGAAMRSMEPLLFLHKAALVVAGHVHAYERTHPVVGYNHQEGGPVHVTVGGTGNREGHADQFYSAPAWSAYREGTMFGVGRLSVRDEKLALWEWTVTEEGDRSGLVEDSVWISNPYKVGQHVKKSQEWCGQQYGMTPKYTDYGMVHLASTVWGYTSDCCSSPLTHKIVGGNVRFLVKMSELLAS
ncbi:unnamed protein product [Choristocarpus tenellus]